MRAERKRVQERRLDFTAVKSHVVEAQVLCGQANNHERGRKEKVFGVRDGFGKQGGSTRRPRERGNPRVQGGEGVTMMRPQGLGVECRCASAVCTYIAHHEDDVLL